MNVNGMGGWVLELDRAYVGAVNWIAFADALCTTPILSRSIIPYHTLQHRLGIRSFALKHPSSLRKIIISSRANIGEIQRLLASLAFPHKEYLLYYTVHTVMDS